MEREVGGIEASYLMDFLHLRRQRLNQAKLTRRTKMLMSAGNIVAIKANCVSNKRAVSFMLISFSKTME